MQGKTTFISLHLFDEKDRKTDAKKALGIVKKCNYPAKKANLDHPRNTGKKREKFCRSFRIFRLFRGLIRLELFMNSRLPQSLVKHNPHTCRQIKAPDAFIRHRDR